MHSVEAVSFSESSPSFINQQPIDDSLPLWSEAFVGTSLSGRRRGEGVNRFRITDKDRCRVLCRGLLIKRLEDLLLVIQSLTAEPEADGS